MIRCAHSCARLCPHAGAEASWLYDDVERTYAAAIRGQLAIWALGMALSLGTMALFNTPNILIWIGPLALVRLLPYLGGILGGGLTIVILLLSLPWPLALLPALIVVVGQNIMGYIVEPRLLGRILRLSPGLVLFVVLIGWKLGGVTGIAFGVPAVAVMQAVAERLISRRDWRRQPVENNLARPVTVPVVPPVPAAGSGPQRTEAAQSQGCRYECASGDCAFSDRALAH
ncbi:AI-2E family transporter [Candidatus Gracilibacteria bacterium]|nr:AI-2E family transporter [Candidatus Gracilibacteria bacterium]